MLQMFNADIFALKTFMCFSEANSALEVYPARLFNFIIENPLSLLFYLNIYFVIYILY